MIANRLETFVVGEGAIAPLQSSTTESANGTNMSVDQL
jgi:hypothetical protein